MCPARPSGPSMSWESVRDGAAQAERESALRRERMAQGPQTQSVFRHQIADSGPAEPDVGTNRFPFRGCACVSGGRGYTSGGGCIVTHKSRDSERMEKHCRHPAR